MTQRAGDEDDFGNWARSRGCDCGYENFGHDPGSWISWRMNEFGVEPQSFDYGRAPNRGESIDSSPSIGADDGADFAGANAGRIAACAGGDYFAAVVDVAAVAAAFAASDAEPQLRIAL